MTGNLPRETVQLAVLDSVLYGAARAVDYLGLRGQVMLDKIGKSIVDYCFKEGYVKRSDNYQEVDSALDTFFRENGYLNDVEYAQEGEVLRVTYRGWQYLGLMSKLRHQECYLLACPLCVASRSLSRANSLIWQLVGDEFLSDGSYIRRIRFVRAAPDAAPDSLSPPHPPDLSSIKYDHKARVGLPAFQAVGYGLALGLAHLGAQAQLLLDNVGRGVIEFLQDEFHIDFPRDLTKSSESLVSFYVSGGLAERIEVHFSSSEAKVAFINYRYISVLRRILDEGSPLISCPFTLAVRSILRNAGWAVGDMKWSLKGDRDVTLSMPILSIADHEFDEDKVRAMMDAV